MYHAASNTWQRTSDTLAENIYTQCVFVKNLADTARFQVYDAAEKYILDQTPGSGWLPHLQEVKIGAPL